MYKIYNAIKEKMLSQGISEDEINSFMEERKFTISFGDQNVMVNKDGKFQWVKKNGMSLTLEMK